MPAPTQFPGSAVYKGQLYCFGGLGGTGVLNNVQIYQGAGGLQINGSGSVVGGLLQLTDGGLSQATSVFSQSPVNIQTFTTTFNFQLLDPKADGFTFAIQNAGPTALGSNGSGLGYWGIPTSLAIKFDIYNNQGEGTDSTGLYIDGAHPTVPAIDLTGTGINLRSGDLFNSLITYDGTNLRMTLTDTVTQKSWTNAWPIDIPSTVGGSTAYVGFTGSTGGYTSTEELLSWTYVQGPS